VARAANEMAAKNSIITNTQIDPTDNNDIDETRASEANEDLQRTKRKFERGSSPFLSAKQHSDPTSLK
jgi:hypothetical protein